MFFSYTLLFAILIIFVTAAPTRPPKIPEPEPERWPDLPHDGIRLLDAADYLLVTYNYSEGFEPSWARLPSPRDSVSRFLLFYKLH